MFTKGFSRFYHLKHSVFALMLPVIAITTPGIHIISVKPLTNKRLDVTPRDVITSGSLVKCSVMCRMTSWCVSANVAPDRSTCQLLTDEVSDETQLESANGWRYIRKVLKYCHNIYIFWKKRIFLKKTQYLRLDVDDCARLAWSCVNGGTAVDTGKSCECQCPAGYTGEHCETAGKLRRMSSHRCASSSVFCDWKQQVLRDRYYYWLVPWFVRDHSEMISHESVQVTVKQLLIAKQGKLPSKKKTQHCETYTQKTPCKEKTFW